MRRAASRKNDDSNVIEFADGFVQGAEWPLVPDGDYQAAIIRHVCVNMTQFKGQPKLFLHFRLVTPGEHHGAVLYRAYRVRSIESEAKGQPVINGRFKLGPRSQLLQDYVRLMDLKTRPDRVSLRAMRRHLFLVRTRTVTSNYRQKDIPAALRYSVVQDILERETD